MVALPNYSILFYIWNPLYHPPRLLGLNTFYRMGLGGLISWHPDPLSSGYGSSVPKGLDKRGGTVLCIVNCNWCSSPSASILSMMVLCQNEVLSLLIRTNSAVANFFIFWTKPCISEKIQLIFTVMCMWINEHPTFRTFGFIEVVSASQTTYYTSH